MYVQQRLFERVSGADLRTSAAASTINRTMVSEEDVATRLGPTAKTIQQDPTKTSALFWAYHWQVSLAYGARIVG